MVTARDGNKTDHGEGSVNAGIQAEPSSSSQGQHGIESRNSDENDDGKQSIVPSTKENDSDNDDDGDDDDDDVNRRLLPDETTTTDRPSITVDSDDDDNDASEHGSSGATTPRPAATSMVDEKHAVRWRDLPQKGQLTVITLARLSEPLVQTSLQSYMFYQLKSFRPDLPDSVISAQSGVLHASFTAAQFVTAMMWGRLADSPLFGRKTVVMIGLGGTMLSCIGFGFSQAFWQALLFRSIGGITNGNVGVLRTMISEIVREKKYQSRAFLLLPMTFNIGVIIGPIMGGLLSDPAHSYPRWFGNNAFLLKFPYATPNLLSALILFTALMGIWLFLDETLEARVGKRDLGVELRKKVASWFRKPDSIAYKPLATHSRRGSESSLTSVEMAPEGVAAAAAPVSPPPHHKRYTQRLPFRRIFTRNVVLTLTANAVFAFHMGTFNSLWFVFLSTPVYDPSDAAKQPPLGRRLPFFFTGGLGLPPREVGLAMAILGCFGILMQLLLYPSLSTRLGTVRSWRMALCLFPLVYFAVPFLSIVPSISPPPHSKDGFGVWAVLASVLFCHVLGRTFAMPAQIILVNNSTPHPSVLGTLHGIAQSGSSLARTVGPMLCGYLYGLGLAGGIVGAIFWGLSVWAVLGCVTSLFVHEGDGHEIWLEGDVEEEA